MDVAFMSCSDIKRSVLSYHLVFLCKYVHKSLTRALFNYTRWIKTAHKRFNYTEVNILVRISVDAMRPLEKQIKLGREGLVWCMHLYRCSSSKDVSTGARAGQEPGGSWGHGCVVLTGLLFTGCMAFFLTETKTTNPGIIQLQAGTDTWVTK